MAPGIERSDAAELQRQSIQPAERGAAEPHDIRAAVKLQALVKTVQRCNVVPVEENHCVRSLDLYTRISFSPFTVVPDSRHHFGFDFSHNEKDPALSRA